MTKGGLGEMRNFEDIVVFTFYVTLLLTAVFTCMLLLGGISIMVIEFLRLFGLI